MILTFFASFQRDIQAQRNKQCFFNGGQAGRNPFSPVKDLPILGFFGAVAAAPLTHFFFRRDFGGENSMFFFNVLNTTLQVQDCKNNCPLDLLIENP